MDKILVKTLAFAGRTSLYYSGAIILIRISKKYITIK